MCRLNTMMNKSRHHSRQQEIRGRNINRALNLDVLEQPNQYVILAELPGASIEEIAIHTDGETVTVEANIPQQRPQAQTRVLLAERPSGHYSRRLRLPRIVNVEQIEARYGAGLLELKLPFTDEQQPLEIPVQTSSET